MKKAMIAGVENALKMREMFIKDGYTVFAEFGYNYNISLQPFTVAVLFVFNYGFMRGYYFYEDGTYFTGSN